MKTVITFFLFLTFKVCLSSENIIEVSLNGEFKDLLSARDYIRVLREDDPKNTYIIEIREGTYRVDEGIIFEKLDNNLIIRAAQGEQVRLVGAKSLDENRFQIVKDKEFLRNLIVPSVAQKIRVYDLFEDEIINLENIRDMLGVLIWSLLTEFLLRVFTKMMTGRDWLDGQIIMIIVPIWCMNTILPSRGP